MPHATRVDLRQKGSSDRLFCQPPLLSSHDSDWCSLHLEHHHQQAIDTPEHTWATPVIVVALGSALQLRGKRDTHEHFQQATRLAIFPAGMSHQYTTQGTGEFLAFSIDAQTFLPALNDSSDLKLRPTLSPDPDSFLLGVALALKAELAAGCPGGHLYEISLATALTLYLLKRYATALSPTFKQPLGLPKAKLKLAVNYIQAHLSETIRLEAIAQLLHMSQWHFCHLFKASMGVPPYQYILQQRIERAKQLLQQQTVPIAEVAFDCGFATQSQLTKYFNRFVGTTPKVYRDRA